LILKTNNFNKNTESEIKANDRDSLIIIPENFEKNLKKQSDTHVSIIGNANNFFQTNRVLNTSSEIITNESDEIFQMQLRKKGISKSRANTDKPII
jgi:hypothetical protein